MGSSGTPVSRVRSGGGRVTAGTALLTVLLVGAAACGQRTRAADAPPEPTQVPTQAYTLLSDGTVPWVDEPITDQVLYGAPRPARTPRPDSKPCRAEQLTGTVPSWTRPGTAGETPRGFDAQVTKLIGQVEIRITSPRECTLQGEVPTRLLAGGVEVPMLYTHGINDEARRRVIVVPAGERASLRVDWSGPFCQELVGALELAIELPNQTGTLRAPVPTRDTPKCGGGKANARAALSSDGFSEPAADSPPAHSPLGGLTLTLTGPADAKAGGRLTYHAVVSNPTAQPVPLDPCPGYYVEAVVRGDGTNLAVDITHQLYRLNCRPVHDVPAGGSVRFEMAVTVPAGTAGRDVGVNWKLIPPGALQDVRQATELRVHVQS